MFGYILDKPDHSYDRGWIYGFACGLVVQADVAADNRNFQFPAGSCHTSYALFHLVVDIVLLWIAEVEAVGNRQGLGAAADQISGCFSHSDSATQIRIYIAVTGIAVGC